MKPAGRVALVTGASRGIGKAIAEILAEGGCDVAVNYLQAVAAAEETVAAIRGRGQRALAVRADVRQIEDVRRMVAQVRQDLGEIDILVNNAGIVRDNLVTFMKAEEWTEVIDTSLKGAFHCIKLVGREMVRRRCGRIVNVSSDAGLMGDVMRANYASAKAGLIGLTKTVAREFAAYGITVNAVAPGIVATDLIAGMAESKRARMLERIPMGKLGSPLEVARVVLFLVSEDAAYITGEVVGVDGGLRM